MSIRVISPCFARVVRRCPQRPQGEILLRQFPVVDHEGYQDVIIRLDCLAVQCHFGSVFAHNVDGYNQASARVWLNAFSVWLSLSSTSPISHPQRHLPPRSARFHAESLQLWHI